MNYRLKHLAINRRLYDANYDKFVRYTKRFIKRKGLVLNIEGNVVLYAMRKANEPSWRRLIATEMRLALRSKAILKDLGLYTPDFCENMHCRDACDMSNPKCRIYKQEKLMEKYGSHKI